MIRGHSLCIDARRSKFVHPDIYEIIQEFRETAAFKNIDLEILGLSPDQGEPPSSSAGAPPPMATTTPNPNR